MENYFAIDTDIYENEELKHFGILGMHWGIRRYQNPDGTLTAEGCERYGVKTVADTKRLSYSQKYESLKNKTNRTPKEQKQLDNLEKGREYLIKNNSANVSLKKLSKEDITNGKLATNYLMSTNYGKTTTLYSLLGGALLSSNYALANESDFLKELKEKDFIDNDENKKNTRKSLGNDLYSMTTKDIINDMENDVLKEMNLDRRVGEEYQDIAIDSDGYIRRKDGKDFTYYIDGVKLKCSYFNDIPTEWSNALNNRQWFSAYPPTKEDKNFLKNFKESLDANADDVKFESFKLAHPVKDEDLDVNVRNVMNIFGLSKEDLVIDRRNKYFPNIYLKDGSALKYKYVYGDGKIIKQMDLQYFADEGDWPGGGIIPLNNKELKIDKNDILEMKSLKRSGYTSTEISEKLNVPLGSVKYYLYEYE